MTVVNKLAVVAFPAPYGLLVIQNAITVILLLILTWISPQHFGGALPALTIAVIHRWIPLVLLFVGMLVTSLMALMKVSASTLVVTRNLTTLVVAFFEMLILNVRLSALSLVALLGIFSGAVLYGLDDLSFNAEGYVWLLVNILCTAGLQIYIKRLIKDQPLEGPGALGPFGMSYYNNMLSLPVLTTMSFASGELPLMVARLQSIDTITVFEVILSGLLGFSLSTTGFLMNLLVSATSMMVANNVSKFAVIALSEIFVERAMGNVGTFGTLLVLLSAWYYSQTKRDYSQDVLLNPSKRLCSWKLSVISCVLALACARVHPRLGGCQHCNGALSRRIETSLSETTNLTQLTSIEYENKLQRVTFVHRKNLKYRPYASVMQPPVVHPEAVANNLQLPMPQSKPVIWSQDLHIAPIDCVKKLLIPMGATFIDKSLSGHCHQTKTCAKDLKVFTPENARQNPPQHMRDAFVAAYKGDPQMAKVDIVMCFHPASMCEVFVPLKKRIFVIAASRYQLWRELKEEWIIWNENLKRIASDPKNVVGANSVYDQMYIRYFTGINAVLLPSVTIMTESYKPSSTDILVTEMHSSGATYLYAKLKSISPRLRRLRTKYSFYSYSQLAENTAILHMPYQTSVMSLFEHYAMYIPILVPSPEFLWDLHDKNDLVSERTWQRLRTGKRPNGSEIPGVDPLIPDPNNDVDRHAFLYWIKFSDFYQWPHILQFTSWKELSDMVDTTDWKSVSEKMKVFHAQHLNDTRKRWADLI